MFRIGSMPLKIQFKEPALLAKLRKHLGVDAATAERFSRRC